MEYQQYLELLRIIIACSIFFVWVVRYQNIVEEFKAYGLPNSLRDGIGITKLSCAYMLATNNPTFISIAASVLAFLMAAAFITHLRCKSPPLKMVPSFSLGALCAGILII